MDLIPVAKEASATENAQRQVALSASAVRLAEVTVAPVERRSVAVEIDMVGKIQFDETRLAYISPRVPGRIDRLYANYVGMAVKAGDHLADMYSPDLVSSQQELLQALKTAGVPAAFTASLLNATRERLRLWGLTADQIAVIERSGQVHDHVTFFSPIGGIVVEKEAREGQYVETGTCLFTVADLTRVWAQLDAYESDLAWLRYAQEVIFEAEAYPGETFKGTIAFIAPQLDSATRTVKVRINVTNTDGRLKPEMFVRATVRAVVSGKGKVIRSDLRGKWMSPMHPEIVKDHPGTCDVCGMPLVRAEELGYAAPSERESALPLVIPASAPLLTGKRAVVYVALPNQPGVYEGRDVVLGARAGDFFLVEEGLREGERVVVNGAFKIDSSLQIQGKTSMMAPTAGSESHAHPAGEVSPAARTTASDIPEAFRKSFSGMMENILAIAAALADDNLKESHAAAVRAKRAFTTVDMTTLSGEAHTRWMQTLQALGQPLDTMAAAHDIETFRLSFASLSDEAARAVKAFGLPPLSPLYLLRCPMAFNHRGANWL